MRLVNTESWSGDWPDTLNTLTLSEEEGRTTITQAVLYPSREAGATALDTGMKKGMASGFGRLEAYLRSIA